jgi:phosphatidate phosphatase APP1
MRALALLAVLLPAAAAAKPAVLLPPNLGRTDEVWIAGRVLKNTPLGWGTAAMRNVGAIAAKNWVGAKVRVSFLGRSATTVSGHDGEFEVAIRAEGGAPFPPGPQPVLVQVDGAKGNGVVHVVPPDAPYLLVSDFDDTVAVTHVESAKQVVANSILKDGEEQEAVPGMAALYRCLASSDPAPAFVFVSGSPVQLAPRMTRFLQANEFPEAALFLRNFGPTTLSGYKEPVLRKLAERFPQPLLLVGDSGEKDPEIYAAFVRDRPGRVLRVWIRRAGEKADAPGRFDGILLFSDPREPLADAASDALAPASCAGPGAVPGPAPAPMRAPARGPR